MPHRNIRRPSITAALLLAAASPLILGCSSAKPPTFTLLSATAAERSEDTLVLDLLIQAENKNPDALPLRAVRYSFSIDGNTVYSGLRSAEATIRRYGSQTFTIPAVIPNTANLAPDAPHRFTLTGSVEYIAPGALADTLFDARLVVPTAPIRASGALDLAADSDTQRSRLIAPEAD